MTIDLDFKHLFYPAQSEEAPTLLLLHGTGGDETALLEVGRALAPQAALLSPRGKVLERGMPRFFRRLAEGVFDIEDLNLRTHELADFIAAAAAEYGFDQQGVVAVGYSNGANIAASLLLHHPTLLAGAILLRPMVPFEPETAPDLSGVPVLIAAGRNDQLVPQEQSASLAELLQEAGAAVTTHWEQGGHDLTNADLRAAQSWLAQRAPRPR